MTQIEISKYLDIPFATLNDWKQEDSNRNKLYELLSNLDIKFVEKILNKKENHRFFHILNRNIDDEKFTYNDIKKAFFKNDYHEGTIKEQTIYSKFFKELEVNELEDFIKTFTISKRNIKNIYISSPFRAIEGIAKKWDKRFRLKHIQSNINTNKSIPSVLQNILNKKNLNV
jgi:hydroxymethylpyrimidine pyrophosphatase-like HAD family hydrolase